MSLKNITFDNITCTKNQKIFQLVVDGVKRTYYADTASELVKLDLTNENVQNKAAMITLSGDVIHPLYSVEKTLVKENIYAKKFKDRNNTSNDLINVFSPTLSSQSIAFTNIEDCLYVLMPTTTLAHISLSDDLLQTIVSVDLSSFNNKQISTCLFDINTIPLTIANELSGIQYNYLYEINGAAEQYYANAVLVGNTFKLKNQLDTTYSMQMPNENELCACRQYIGIGKCGNTLYLKYIDNIDYDIENNICLSSNNLRQLQNVEVIDQINRHNTNSYPNSITQHKANLFSIKIKNDGIEQLLTPVKNNIKQEIKNNVRQIVKNLCPINTQLFDVYFNSN